MSKTLFFKKFLIQKKMVMCSFTTKPRASPVSLQHQQFIQPWRPGIGKKINKYLICGSKCENKETEKAAWSRTDMKIQIEGRG